MNKKEISVEGRIRQYFLNNINNIDINDIKDLVYITYKEYVIDQIFKIVKSKILTIERKESLIHECWNIINNKLKTYTPIWEFKSFLQHCINIAMFEFNKIDNLNIVFLDLDGVVSTLDSLYEELENFFVLNSQEINDGSPSELCKNTGLYYPNVSMKFWPFDQNAIKNLYKLQKITGCMFVLSSSWRKGRTLIEINELIQLKGLKLNFIDKTPNFGDRGAEIEKWILNYKYKVDNYVVLDDDSGDIKSYHPNNFVQTEFKTGFTNEKLQETLKILKNEI
jgi:hypothetical protein